MPSHFEIRPDPVRMTNAAIGACLFLRSDVAGASETVWRSYSEEQVREGIRTSSSQRPLFSPGFDPSIPLQHATQITSFTESHGDYPKVDSTDPIVSDTGQLRWYHNEPRAGLVTVDTDRSAALIGFVRQAKVSVAHLAADVENEFSSIALTSLDGKPIADAAQLLLVATARAANQGMKWNDDRTTLLDWGNEPMVIEPVQGQITLKNLNAFRKIDVVPLNSGAKPLAPAVDTDFTTTEARIRIGRPPTCWYLIRLHR